MCFVAFFLVFSFSSATCSADKFIAAGYYWPMTQTNMTVMYDMANYQIKGVHGGAPAELHAINFIFVRRLGWAAALHNKLQWIDVDAGDAKDCLAFQFSSCNDEEAISITFWIRLRGGGRVLATGSYTNSSQGPGVLIRYDEKRELLRVKMASSEKIWSAKIVLPRYAWCHVVITWTSQGGLLIVLDGRVNDADSTATDKYGMKHSINGKPYTKMITIGRPRNISDIRNYGNFDMAHLVFYFRELTNLEIEVNPKLPMKAGKRRDLECCHAKSEDECIRDPCSSRDCLKIERNYKDCICIKVKHTRCPAYPTTEPQTTPRNCNQLTNLLENDIFGCGNYRGTSLCGSTACYYGTCESVNDMKQCRCDVNCTVLPYSPVCGYNSKQKTYSTYDNLCVMKKASCLQKEIIELYAEHPCVTPIKNATHYWSMKEITSEKIAKDVNGEAPLILHNDVTQIIHNQLGFALNMDGKNNWGLVRNLEPNCFSNLQCDNGMTVGFWMEFSGGDYIFTAGGFAAGVPSPPGFRLLRDQTTKIYKLEVATENKIWKLFIYKFPTKWFYLSFSWHPVSGLKLYFNGELKLQTAGEPRFNTKSRRQQESMRDFNKMYLARYDAQRESDKHGKFRITHLALWKKALSQAEIRQAYSANVAYNDKAQICCYHIKTSKAYTHSCGINKYPDEWQRIKNETCICTDVNLEAVEKQCNAPVLLHPTECVDRNPHCKQLAVEQTGFCEDIELATDACISTCNKCESPYLASVGPQQHFSQETVIISLLGCIGGLILLLGLTVYFWKIYRTRYHGRFVPPIKTVSLLDVSDYEDEKWPNKYIDNAAFYIKDVPPKKRALPLIPARNATSSHRYQPPEFD